MVEPGPEPLGTLLPRSTFAARPPTPPKQSHRGDGKPGFISRLFYGDPQSRSNPPPSLSNITPSSSAESLAHSPTPATLVRKKVGWSDSTEYNDPPKLPLEGPVVPLSAKRKPLKSILKTHNGALEQDSNGLGTSTKLLPLHHHSTLATMLESIVQQLAGKDRSSKIDAYLMLSSSLKASENIPDLKALDSKMGLLLQFITRDLSEKTEAGKPDTPVVINALVLLSSFLHKQAIKDSITSDFSVFIVDYAIRTFEDPQMSKEIVKHLMFVLAQQRFSARVMNTERVGKLVTALHNIEFHIKGKSIATGRLNIYRTLLRQSKSQLITHTIWIDDLFADMLSGIKEIRTMAINFGLEASYALGGDSKPSRFVSNFFQTTQAEGIKFAEFYLERLKQLLQKKQDLAYVPQIWSVIMLFLRGKPKQLEQWPFLSSYLDIVQRCFNSSDPTTRIEANYAWNRFVFAVGLNEKTSIQVVKILCKPLITQLVRLRNKSSASRKAILGSSCNLLYYSLRPNSTPARLDLFWDEYVVPLVAQSLTPTNIIDNPELARRDLLDSCQILQSLFDSTTPRPWDESRAMENLLRNGVAASELPALDPKWLRKNPSRVFVVLVPILEKLYWELGSESEVTALWHTYITSIASPAAMEVKVSNDTMASIASIFGFLYKIWHTGPFNISSLSPPKTSRAPEFIKSFERLLIVAMQGLGLLPFTERHLSIGTQDTFVPVATPSHRPEKLKGEVKSPLCHLFSLMTTISPNLEYDDGFLEMAHSILLPFFEMGTSTRTSRIDLAKDLLHLLPQESSQPCRIMWRILAGFTTITTGTRDNDKNSHDPDQTLGAEYRNIIKILEAGVNISSQHPLPSWEGLFEASITSASIDAGDAGRAIVIVEPLAKFLTHIESASFSSHATGGPSYYHLLITKATYPKNRQALDTARRRLWGTGNPGPKGSTFDPYSQLYKYIQRSLADAHASYDSVRAHDYIDMFAVTTAFIGRCPMELRLGILTAVQEGVSPWVLDSTALLKAGSSLAKEIFALWNTICAVIPQVARTQGVCKILLELELLICSGLESMHRPVVIQTIYMWNSTFGQSEEPLEYRTRLKDALIRIDSVADIQLPFFPESLLSSKDDGQNRQPIEFVESQENSNNFMPSHSMESILKAHPTPHMAPSQIRHELRETTPQVLMHTGQSSSRKRPSEATPEIGKRKSQRRENTPAKLRHNDSQILFQAVESSPTVETRVPSQLLTARQMEVKERQHIEAAMFPDLRSSPDGNVELELPIHRSPRSQIKSPSTTEHPRRLTTPDPFPPSEDDSFIVSSPTPKQDTNQHLGPSTPLFLPPELSPKKQGALQPELGSAFDFDIPSSPPESLRGPDIEPQTSVSYPSALVGNYATQNYHVKSTLDNTGLSDQHPLDKSFAPRYSIVGSPSRTLRGKRNPPASASRITSKGLPGPAALNSTPGANDNTVASPKGVEIASIDTSHKGSEAQQPTTPPLRSEGTNANQKTPTTPQFVDAMSSPPSSDSINDDIFEDAVSSPRRIVQKTRKNREPSPPSEFDESSVLRIMEDYDEGPAVASTRVVDAKKSPRRQTRASSRNNSLQSTSPVHPLPRGSMRIAALQNATAAETSKIIHHDKESNSAKKPVEHQSSLPSMIPETPGFKLPVSLANIIVNGEVLSAENTIVVDASVLENEGRAAMAGRPRKQSSIATRKRRHEDLVGDASPALDSKDVESQTSSPKRTSPKKRQRGRPKKASRLSQEVLTDVTMQDIAGGGVIDESLAWAEEPPNSDKSVISDVNQTLSSNVLEVMKTSAGYEPLQHTSEGSSVEVIEETILGASSTPIESSSSAPVEQDSIPRGTVTAVTLEIAGALADSPIPAPSSQNEPPSGKPEFSLSISTNPPSRELPNSGAAATSTASPAPSDQADLPTFQTIKERLQNVVRDLGLTALSKDEVNDIEYIFMDAKEQLYGAARRGRQMGNV